MPEKKERSEAEIVGLKVVSVNPADVDTKGYKFKTAKQIDKKVKRAERILSFDDPDNPEEPIHVHLRALTSNEEAILHQSNISKKDVQSLVSVFLEKTETEKDGKLEPSDITDIVAEKIANNSEDEENVNAPVLSSNSDGNYQADWGHDRMAKTPESEHVRLS